MGCNRRKQIMVILFFFLTLTAGCRSQQSEATAPEAYRVVTQIEIVYHHKPIVSEGTFSDPEKMQQILLYLRQISPYGTPAEDPEQAEGSDFYITLHYSDRSKKVYHQRADRFLRINNGPWKRIDPKKAMKLSEILATMDSDTIESKNDTPWFLMPQQ